MTRYASKSRVLPTKSRDEIEKLVVAYGATGYLSGWDDETNRAFVQFRMEARVIKLTTRLPQLADPGLTTVAKFEQARRSHWRAMVLLVKAKLEAVASGIVTFEEEFFPHVVMPDGGTVYERAAANVAIAYETGKPVALLPDHGKGSR